MFPSLVFGLLAVASASAAIFEAESGTLAGNTYFAKDLPGFTGTGYVTNFTGTGDGVTISVTGLAAGSYDIAVVYSAQYGNKFTSASVNGAATTEVAINNVTSSNWATSSVGTFALTAGTNTVKFSSSWGWYFIDSIKVTPAVAAPIVVVDVTNGAIAEAENGILSGTTVGTRTAGFSGKGFVESFDDYFDNVTITVYSKTQSLYDVVIRYAAIYGYKETILSVNGVGDAQIQLEDTTTAENPWANATAGKILLNAGNNTITLSTYWGWYFIDSIYVTPAPAPAPHRISKHLVAPSPLPVTLALYKKLVSKYGSGDIFSGQADPTGVAWLENNIGKTPAIIGLDMIEYSPTRVEFGSTSTAVEDAIAFDARGGIVAFQWHWNAPADLINDANTPWWEGFYSYGSTYNLTAALADTTSQDYALLISDMDAIATQLLRLQAANVPVLWRPLHEAEGAWFWWGKFGAESCKALYRLMFHRYTKHHKLRNLIWVWNSIAVDWYPGSSFVDILGYDSYPIVASDHGPVSAQYQQLLALGNDTKIVTLPEVGSIPDPDILKLFHADWSYFVTWSDEYIESDISNDLAFKKKVYNDPRVLKLTNLGSWKGTATVKPTSPPISTTSKSTTSTTKISTTTSKSTTTSRSSSTSTTTPVSSTPTPNAHYGQCGGFSFSGSIECVPPYSCFMINQYYSWCV